MEEAIGLAKMELDELLTAANQLGQGIETWF